MSYRPKSYHSRMDLFRFAFLSALISLSTLLAAQPGNPAQADTAALKQQFDDMLKASNRYQTFKVVRQNFLNAFMSNVSDSIVGYTREIGELKQTIATQKTKIEEQATTISEREANIGELTDEKDSISLLGVPLSKTMYSLILWSAIGVLLVGLLLALARMRVAVASSKEARLANEKVTAELEASRKSRLKVEQNLRRQLQDERNKNA